MWSDSCPGLSREVRYASVIAGSLHEITDAFAQVEVVTDPARIERVSTWSLPELEIGQAKVDGPLASLFKLRERQRRKPAFDRLFGKDPVYVRLPDPEADGVSWLMQLDATGRRIRQVEVRAGGAAVASSTDDWPMNPPIDLGDPEIASGEISADEFEAAWRRATAE